MSIHGAVGIGELMDVSEIEESLATLGSAQPALRAQLLGALAEVYWTARLRTAADRCAREALDLARDAGDHCACAEMHIYVSMTQGQRLRLLDAVRSLQAGMDASRLGDDLLQFDRCAQRIPPLLLMAGQLDEVAAAVERTRDLHRSDALIGPMSMTMLSAMRGDLAQTESHAMRAIRRMSYSKLLWAATAVLTGLAYARALHGDSAGADAAIAMLLEPGRVFDHPRPRAFEIYRTLIRIYAGDEPRREAAASLKPIAGAGDPDYFTVFQACAQVEIAHALGLTSLPDSVFLVLDAAAETDILFTPGWPFFLPRLRGLAALVRGEWDEAVARLRSAITLAGQLRADAELYRVLTDLGTPLVGSPDPTRRRAGEELMERAVHLSSGRFRSADAVPVGAP